MNARYSLQRAVGVLTSAVVLTFLGAVLAGPADAASKRAVPVHVPASSTTPTTALHATANVPAPTPTPAPAPAPAPAPSMATPGYWLADASGEVGSFGGVPFRSSLQSTHVNAPVMDLVPTYDGNGYWMVGADGGVFAFGNAGYYGSLTGQHLNGWVTSMAAASADHGYWLAATDGGVFAFGNAGYYGSPAGSHLDAPVIAILPTPDARGYWLVSSDGGVFAYGDAAYHGSLVGTPLQAKIVGAAATPDGGGYWLAAADGGVFAFGDASFRGSLSTTTLHEAVVSIAPTPDGNGYWLAAADGGVFAFGDAAFRGSASGNVPPGGHIVAIAAGPGVPNAYGAGTAGNFAPAAQTPAAAAPVAPAPPQSVGTEAPGAVGYDISWPQCNGPFPGPSTLAIVGINNGTAFTTNHCFKREAAWAGLNLSVYINLNAPDPAHPEQFANGPAGGCAPGNSQCDFYNFGYNAAMNAMENTYFHGSAPRQVWLDVETSNIWSADTWLNDQVISGAITALQRAGATPGIYSTAYQYSVIAGTFHAAVPEWLATGVGLSAPAPGCASPSFTGGRVTLVQGYLGAFDGDFAC